MRFISMVAFLALLVLAGCGLFHHEEPTLAQLQQVIYARYGAPEDTISSTYTDGRQTRWCYWTKGVLVLFDVVTSPKASCDTLLTRFSPIQCPDCSRAELELIKLRILQMR